MAADLYADYVIVGAGSAGCVLANRLTASGEFKVVVLEAGGDDRPLRELGQFMSNMLVHIPIGFGKTLNDPKVNWLYDTEVDAGTGGRPHKWPKGKVLGGSSSINGLLYVRGQSADYDGWAQMGARGWTWDDCWNDAVALLGSEDAVREYIEGKPDEPEEELEHTGPKDLFGDPIPTDLFGKEIRPKKRRRQ